jgi:RNA polymerase sigma-70 factor (ECF subfamily)
MPWPDSDEALVEMAKGDPEAFGELYERHVKRVYNYIYYRVGAKRQDAEDLTARTFLQALAHLPRFRQQGVPISAWLLRIAHNLVANWHRDNRRQYVPLDEAAEVREGADQPGEAAEKREERRELLAAIAELPTERQQLIVLRFVQGMRAADIAVVMGRSEGAVKALLHRTLTSLRKNLSEAALNQQQNASVPFAGR